MASWVLGDKGLYVFGLLPIQTCFSLNFEPRSQTVSSASHGHIYPQANAFTLQGSVNACSITQSCPTLCDLMECSPPGSSIHGISPGKNTGVGWPFPSPGDLPNPAVEPGFPALVGAFFTTEPPGKPSVNAVLFIYLFS